MTEEPRPDTTRSDEKAPPAGQTDDDEAARAAQAEDPTSPERGFDEIEHHDAGQEES